MPAPATSIPFEQTGLGRILGNPNRTSRDWIDAAFGSLGAQDRGNQAAGAALGLANELAGEENRRQSQTVGFLTEQFNRANAAARPQPGEMAAKMGRATDAATGQALDEWRGLRDYLGSAGVGGRRGWARRSNCPGWLRCRAPSGIWPSGRRSGRRSRRRTSSSAASSWGR